VTSWKVMNTTEEGHNEVGVNTIALAYRHSVEKVNAVISFTSDSVIYIDVSYRQHNAEFDRDKVIKSGNLYVFDEKITGNQFPPKTRDTTLKAFNDQPMSLEEMEELSDYDQMQRSHYAYISLCNGINTNVRKLFLFH
jgi:hypothetical protein